MTRAQAIDFLHQQIARFNEQLQQGIHVSHNEMCIKYARKHIKAMEGKK